jgi:hypothetical protein
MAKRVDPLKAKAAKQKKIAIGLSLLFVLVLAYQGPKTLKMLKGPAATEAVEAVPVPVGEPVQSGTPSAGTPSLPGSAPGDDVSQPAVLANSDLPVAPGDGQLLSFERFESKDPFKQQVDATAVDPTAPDDDSQAGGDPAAPATDPVSPGTDPVSPGTDPSIPGSAENPPLSTGGIGGSGSSEPGSGSSDSPSAPSTPAPPPAAATTISINGVEQPVVTGTPFPEDQPTFELVSVGQDGKSVQIGVAGGSLAGGAVTVKLTIGKPVTLQNTADGSRYKLELLTVEGFAAPASKG